MKNEEITKNKWKKVDFLVKICYNILVLNFSTVYIRQRTKDKHTNIMYVFNRFLIQFKDITKVY